MLTIKNVQTLKGFTETITIESDEFRTIDGKGSLLLIPALIDPHVHFRTPGAEHKEDWCSGAVAAIRGGITRVFDMPNNTPACVTPENLQNKINLIDEQLKKAGIPLRYNLYYGADQENLDSLGKVAKNVIGLKIYMGSSTGGLVMNDPETLEKAFRLAGHENVLVAVHAEDEEMLEANKKKHRGNTDPSVHSIIREEKAALKATMQAIDLAEKYGTQLVICHTSTKEELDAIRAAKKRELLVYCEVCTHHLFLNTEDYGRLGSFGTVNPPLRNKIHCDALWEGIRDGTVDFLGTDHAPHTREEKSKSYPETPSGFPGIETMLPLLLNAYHEKKISLEKIVSLTHINIEQIFGLERNQDFVLIDLEMKKEVKATELKTKSRWSPYDGVVLKGWPLYTILKGKVYSCF